MQISTCTIPPDPTDDTVKRKCKSARVDYNPPPRVRPDACKIYQMHKGSIGLLFGLDKHQIATGFKSREEIDHIKRNVTKMRQIQKLAKERNEEKERLLTPKSKPVITSTLKYSEVPSKVVLELEHNAQSNRQKHKFLQAHSRPGSAPPPANASESTNKSNFIAHNIKSATKLKAEEPHSLKLKHSMQMEQQTKEEYVQSKKGIVPAYLLKRKADWKKEQEHKLANAPDPEMPPGHRKMSESERLSTLKSFNETKNDLVAKLLKLPLAARSSKIVAEKDNLERQISQIEEAILIFQRPKVFVKIDD